MNLVFDIETNGLTNCNTIWCIVAYDIDAEVLHSFGPKEIDEGMEFLSQAEKLIGHNILSFDIPTVRRLTGVDLFDKKIVDTLVLSRLFNPTREGGHGLEAWGYRLKYNKIDFHDYNKFSSEMLEYCERDVQLNARVYLELRKEAKGFSGQSIKLEHDCYRLLDEQRINGFMFDTAHAHGLVSRLKSRLSEVVDQVHQEFKPKVEKFRLYARDTKTGVPSKMADTDSGKRVRMTDAEYKIACVDGFVDRHIETEFNLGSRKQIGEYLQDFGWKPTKFTPTGQPIVDEGTLMEIDDIPQAQLIAEYLLLQKRLAQIKSWFKFSCEDGRVHGYVNSNGTITGRMTHRDPNMAQVPSTRAPYGKDCRKCWHVPTGYKLVGIDASGLELRMLAHYMNDEAFTNEILNGDIHTANQKLAGLESRDQAKTFIYALIYGAGNEKLGTVVGGNKSHGKRLRESFLNNLPAFAALTRRVERASAKGYVRGIDGRKIFIRSAHAALNSLLQGAGAIVMKKALVLFDDKLKSNNLNAKIVANIHDEWQVEALAQDAELVGELGIDAIVEAGVALELNCQLDGEYNVGDDWSETH